MSYRGQVTVGPRVEFRIGRYVRIRARDPDTGTDRYLYLHRLTLYAAGELDTPWRCPGDDLDGHHCDSDGWNNHPRNLEARPSTDHGAHHRRAQLEES